MLLTQIFPPNKTYYIDDCMTELITKQKTRTTYSVYADFNIHHYYIYQTCRLRVVRLETYLCCKLILLKGQKDIHSGRLRSLLGVPTGANTTLSSSTIPS